MQLSKNIAIAAGILVEILFLWETADRQKTIQPAPGILSSRLSRIQEIIAVVTAVSWLLIVIAEFWNPTLTLGQLSLIQNSIMGPSFFFLFGFGMVAPKLLPRINEQTIVVINLLVLYSLFTMTHLEWYWLAAMLIPSLGILVMALTTSVIHPTLKSLLYFWYLLCLLMMAYQSNFEMFFKPSSELQLTSVDYFIAGMAGIFLLLHSIFLVRFFLMLTANILPQNRYLIRLAMPQLFDDEQIPRLKFFGILAGFAVIVIFNYFTNFLPSLSLLNVLVLAAVHFMGRPFKLTERLY